MDANSTQIYEFGAFRLDLIERLLTQNGKPIALTPKAFEVLAYLVERRGHLVEKAELMNEVWSDSIVEEANLSRTIWMLRTALCDDRNGHEIIQTVPKHGYRFVAEVKESDSTDSMVESGSSSDDHGLDERVKPVDSETPTTAASLENEPAVGQIPTVHAARDRRFWLWALAGLSLFVIPFMVFQFGFSGASSNSSFSFERMNITRLTQSGRVASPTISPDGQYIAYLSLGDGLTLGQVATGSSQPIVPHRPDVHYWDWKFAPDNSNFYFVAAEEPARMGILYQTTTLGGKYRKITEFVNGGLTFSPDGKRIAFKRIDPEKHQTSIVAINIDGTNEQTITSIDSNSDYWSLDWSPDGASIAYAIRRRDSANEFWYVAEIPVAGGVERRIGEPHDLQIIAARWRPGKRGLFVSAIDPTTQQPQIYEFSYPDGVERRITNDTNRYRGISVTADGRSILAEGFNWDRQIWIAQIENAGLAKRLTNAIDTNYDTVDWTANNYLVFDWDEKGNYGNNNIWRMRDDGIDLQQLTFGTGRDLSPTVSPDGQTIVFVSSRTGTKQLWRIGIDGGQPTQLTDIRYAITYPRFSPDGQTVYFKASVGGEGHLWRVRISGGDATEVGDAEIGFWAISPDGGRVAYSFLNKETGKNQVRIRPLDEDRTEVILDIEPVSWMEWSNDGSSIYYNGKNDLMKDLWRQPVDGAPPKRVTAFPGEEQLLRFSFPPDGKHVACIRQKLSVDAVLIRFGN